MLHRKDKSQSDKPAFWYFTQLSWEILQKADQRNHAAVYLKL